jgi:hypothetical protein
MKHAGGPRSAERGLSWSGDLVVPVVPAPEALSCARRPHDPAARRAAIHEDLARGVSQNPGADAAAVGFRPIGQRGVDLGVVEMTPPRSKQAGQGTFGVCGFLPTEDGPADPALKLAHELMVVTSDIPRQFTLVVVLHSSILRTGHQTVILYGYSQLPENYPAQ